MVVPAATRKLRQMLKEYSDIYKEGKCNGRLSERRKEFAEIKSLVDQEVL